jgi:hypothetical protein
MFHSIFIKKLLGINREKEEEKFMSERTMIQNKGQSKIDSSKSFDPEAKSIIFSKEFIDTFTQIMFLEK